MKHRSRCTRLTENIRRSTKWGMATLAVVSNALLCGQPDPRYTYNTIKRGSAVAKLSSQLDSET